MSAAEMAFPLRGERVTVRKTGNAIVVQDRDGEAIGTVQLEWPTARELIIRTLCIDSARRGYGAGTEAAQMLLEAARGKADTVRAWAPPDLGLAVYFWIRMGLQPLHGEGPEGGIWFERTLTPSP